MNIRGLIFLPTTCSLDLKNSELENFQEDWLIVKCTGF